MGREIDERVVQMKFENGQFEKGISTSIRSMEELKKGMDFDDAVKGFEKLDVAAKSFKLDGLSSGIEAVRVKFDLLQITAFRVLDRIATRAIDTGERMVKGLTIEQVTAGWGKFEEKTGSVQTIMAATSKQFTDTGEQMEYVNAQLDKLNWFTDETSYNFVDMVNNIGKFTSNNIALDESVTAMQGIANWAAISGANANEASRAMYNLSQSMASGSMKLMDWMSIENANMGTAAFKEMAIEAGLAAGTLMKQGDKIVSVNKKLEVSVEKFRDTLSSGWLSKNVLMSTLNEYGAATNKLNQLYEETGQLTSSIVGDIEDYQAGVTTAKDISENWGKSLEETQQILDEFGTETMKFGLKAFKAAQEAKTFSDVINATKDAVSTGWMKSFEYIFGDYIEAKELFSELAEIFYDIFAVGGEARNESLKFWKKAGGRVALIDSLWAAFAAILNVLNPIKAAWNDVFGELTWVRLKHITDAIHDFALMIAEVSQKNVPKLQRTFRGVFAIFDMLGMVLNGAVKIGLAVIEELFGALNVDVLEFTGSIGDAIFGLQQWLKEGRRFDKFVADIIKQIKNAIRSFKDFVNTIKNSAPVKAALDAIHSLFNENFNGIESILTFAQAAFSALWSFLTSLPKITSFDDLGASLNKLGEDLFKGLEDMGISMEGFQKIGDKVFGAFSDFFGKFSVDVKGASGAAASGLGLIQAELNKVDWAGVALLATGVAILALAWKFADAAATIAKSFGKVTDVMKSVKTMTDNIGGYFKALKDNVQSNQIIKIAVAIAILAGAFYALAKLDGKALLTASGALFVVTAAIVALMIAMEKTGKNKLEGGGAKGFAAVILSFAASVALIAKALEGIDTENILPRLAILGTIMVAMSVLVKRIGKGTNIASVMPSVGAYISMGAAIYLLVGALKRISDLGTEDLFGALPVLAGLMVVMASCARLATRTVLVNKSLSSAGFKAGLAINKSSSGTKTAGGFGAIIAMALAITVLVGAIKKLGSMNPEVVAKGLIGVGAIFVELSVLMIAARAAGEHAAKAGKMLLYISIALNLIGPAIKGLGSIKPSVLAKGMKAITGIAAIMSALMVFSKFTGQHATKAGLMFIAVAGAMMALQLVVKTLGKVDSVELLKGVASTSAVILALGKMIQWAGGQYNVDSTKSIVKLTVLVGLVSALMLALTFIEPTKVLASTAGISAVLLSLGYSLKMMKDMEMPKLADLVKLYSIVIALGAVIGAISHFTNPASVLATATGLSAVLLATSAAGRILKNAKMPTVKQATGWAIIIGSIGAVIGAVAAIQHFMPGMTTKELLALTTGISEVLIALGVAGRIMDKNKNPSINNTRAMNEWVISVGILVGSLAIVMGVINAAGGSIDGLLTLTTAISEIFLALGIASRIMGKNGGDFSSLNPTSMLAISGFVAVAGLVLAAFSNLTNPDTVIPLATALSEFMIALGATVKIMSATTKDVSGMNLGSFALLSAIAAIMGIVLSALSNMVNPQTVLPIALGLSAVMTALGAVVTMISYTPPAVISGAWSALGMMGVIVAALGALTVALGGLMQQSGFKQILADGGEGMKLLGTAIGNFIGGLVGGFIGGALDFIPTVGKYLSDFMTNAKGFFDGIKNVPANIGDVVGSITVALLAITGADILNAISNFASKIFGTGDTDLAGKFESFGKALKAFSDALGDDFDAENAKAAAEAGQALADLEASLPRQGGELQKFLGSKDLDQFALKLPVFGAGLRAFSIAVDGMNVDGAKAAVEVGQALSDLERSLPAQNGKLQEWLGEQNIGEFGTRIVAFGFALKLYALTVKDITSGMVEGAYNAGKMMTELESTVPRQGGALQAFIGSSSIGDFGGRMKNFGEGLKNFSEEAEKVKYDAVETAIKVTTDLIAMENSIETTGGWGELFTGKSDFSSLGENLAGLGRGLNALSNSLSAVDLDKVDKAVRSVRSVVNLTTIPNANYASIVTIGANLKLLGPSIKELGASANEFDSVKMDQTTGAIRRLLELAELKSSAEWLKACAEHASTMVTQFKLAVDKEHENIRKAGKSIAEWFVKGITQGLDEYMPLATNSATKLAERVDEAVCKTLGIASPSVVMIEEGHWIVRGLAEGITSDTSAEEAAEKKASNIVSAFQTALDKIDLLQTNRQKKFDLWSVSEGLGASDAEYQQRALELKEAELRDAAEQVKIQQAAFETAQKLFAEGSKQWIEAENRVLDAKKAMYDIRNEIEQSQTQLTIVEANSFSRNAQAYESYIREWETAYEMMGYSKEDLYKKAAEATGFGKEDTGAGRINTQAIIDAALGEQQVEIAAEQTKQRIKKAVSGATVDGVNAGLTEATNILGGNGGGSSGATGGEDPIGAGMQYLNNALDKSGLITTVKDTTQAVMETGVSGGIKKSSAVVNEMAGGVSTSIGNTLIDKLKEATGTHSPSVITYEIGQDVGQGLINGMDQISPQVINATNSVGLDAMEGFRKGIAEKGQAAIAEATAVAQEVAAQMAQALQIASPSKLTRSYGNYLDEGLVLGMRDGLGNIKDATYDVANSAADALDRSMALIDNIIESDDSFSPKITPVINLDDLKKQGPAVQRALGKTRLNVDTGRIQSNLSARNNPNSQNGSNQNQNQTNYNFTQNNYSPKALNRAEIYRQTRNQFSQLKGASRR